MSPQKKAQNSGRERRRFERAPTRQQLEISVTEDNVIEGYSVNLSANGVLCVLRDFVEPFTDVNITLFLPGEIPEKFVKVSTTAVVVRTTPGSPGADSYEVALYFPNLSPIYHLVLADFVRQANQRKR